MKITDHVYFVQSLELLTLIAEVRISFEMDIDGTKGKKYGAHLEYYLLFLGGVEVTVERVGRRE